PVNLVRTEFQIDCAVLPIKFLMNDQPLTTTPRNKPSPTLTTLSILPTNHNWTRFHANTTAPFRLLTIPCQTPFQLPVSNEENTLMIPSMMFVAPCITPFMFCQTDTISNLMAGHKIFIKFQIKVMIGFITLPQMNLNVVEMKLPTFRKAV